MFYKKIIISLWLTVTIADHEADGTSNYLLEDTHQKYAISYNGKENFKEGQIFNANVNMDCELDYAIDEIMSDKLNQWITYRAYICNANSIEVQDEKDLP